MKSLLVTLMLVASSAFAAQNKEIEFGKYTAVDVETGDVHTAIEIRPNGTAHFDMSSPDFNMPAPGCEGTYKVVGNILVSDLECPIFLFSQVHVEIDITNVNPQSIRTQDGVVVPVKIDLLGDEPQDYRLKKAE